MTSIRDRFRRAARLLRSGDRPLLTWLFWLAPWVTTGAGVYAGVLLAGYLDEDLPAPTPSACIQAMDAAEAMFAIDDRLITLSTELGYAAHVGDAAAAAEVTAEWEALWPDIEAAVTDYWAAAFDCRWPALSGEATR